MMVPADLLCEGDWVRNPPNNWALVTSFKYREGTGPTVGLHHGGRIWYEYHCEVEVRDD